MRVVLIDNLDSFTYNLVHCFQLAGAEVVIVRNPELALKYGAQPLSILAHGSDVNVDLLNRHAQKHSLLKADWSHLDDCLLNCDAWVVGPGPGHPQEYVNLLHAMRKWLGVKPMIGICLGLQALALLCGGRVGSAVFPMHGKPSMITHNRKEIFQGLSEPMQVGRYHSLVVDLNHNDTNDSGLFELFVDATCGSEIMALSNSARGVWAVQFHPESVLTPEGQALLVHWVRLAAEFIRA